MKQIFFCLIALLVLSCNNQTSGDLLKIVNDQNDGWNAFSITLRKGGTYVREDFGSIFRGKYNISGNTIFLNNEKIVFEITPYGCIFNIRYISKSDPTPMLVVFDKLFCGQIPVDSLIGNWQFKDLISRNDTLKLLTNRTAEFQKQTYHEWQINYSTLSLSKDNISTPWFIMNIKHDTVWLIPPYSRSIDTANVFKAVRLKN